MKLIGIFFVLLLLVSPVFSALEAIVTGYPRTGTDSLKDALNLLGYKTYHMKVVGMNHMTDHVKTWKYLVKNNCETDNAKELLKSIYEDNNFTATVGINFPCTKQLMNMYPNAKIIHTQRTDDELWHNSVMNSACVTFTSPLFRLARVFSPFIRSLYALVKALFFNHLIKEPEEEHRLEVNRDVCMAKKEQMIASYNTHNRRIPTMVPPERLLVIVNHKGGWQPLCEFLDKPLPKVPYPRSNSRKDFQDFFRAKMKDILQSVRIPAAIILGTLVLVSRWFTLKSKQKAAAKAKKD
jgi:hypothetical protein